MTLHATTTEVLKAFAALTGDDLLALRKIAYHLINNTSFSEPQDLIHEALYRAVDGRRNWPTHIDFGIFMSMTMRSIANSERNLLERKFASRFSIEELMEIAPESLPAHPSAEDDFIAAEQFNLAAKTAADARKALSEDPAALHVLNGYMAGMSPAEMRTSFHLDSKTFDSARHRVMRRLQSAGRLH